MGNDRVGYQPRACTVFETRDGNDLRERNDNGNLGKKRWNQEILRGKRMDQESID